MERSAFNPGIKCDYVTNNLAEYFNNWTKDWKELPIVELADKIRGMIMRVWNTSRLIGEELEGKILPAVVRQLKARTTGLEILIVVQFDSFVEEVWDTSTTHNTHVVKSYLQECSCLEWQHTRKPCQHALVLIIAQQSSDVKIEDFVHEYYSIKRFKDAYKRLIEPLPDRTQWTKGDLPSTIGAPLWERGFARYMKLSIKGYLKGGSGGKRKKDANQANKEVKMEAEEADKGKRQLNMVKESARDVDN